jgi:hypothetical protein
MQKVKVIYIAGWGRSGSTILGNLLGGLEGCFHAGEMIEVWDRGIVRNHVCGCGEKFSDCNVWNRIINQAYGQDSADYAHKIGNIGVDLKVLPLLTHFGASYLGRFREKEDLISKIYEAIQSEMKTEYIIDGSKNIAYALLLKSLPSIDLYVLHLVRDPRAVVFSWAKRKSYLPKKLLEKAVSDNTAEVTNTTDFDIQPISPILSSFKWLLHNLASQLFLNDSSRYKRLYYEEFTRNPQEALTRIENWVMMAPKDLPFAKNGKAIVNVQHAISGNPSRFNTGEVDIKLDTRWKKNMPFFDRILTTVLVSPLLVFYKLDRSNKRLFTKQVNPK